MARNAPEIHSRRIGQLDCAFLAAVARILGSLLICQLLGCGRSDALCGVSGQVTLNGKAAPKARILFSNEQLGIHRTADVEDGQYSIANREGIGLPPGAYRVSIHAPLVDHPIGPILKPPNPHAKSDIPLRYRSETTSGLTAELTVGENAKDFPLTQ